MPNTSIYQANFKIAFVCFTLFFLSISKSSFAGDSTNLYKNRLKTIKALSEWLSKKPLIASQRFNFDSIPDLSKFYDTSIGMFFDKLLLDSIYLYEGDMVRTPSHKLNFLKRSLASLHLLSYQNKLDSLRFKNTKITNQRIEPIWLSKTLISNSITCYHLIDDEEYETFIFLFAENNARLIGIVGIGYSGERLKKFNHYNDKLINNQ